MTSKSKSRTCAEVTGWMIVAVLLTVMLRMMLWCPDDETIRVLEKGKPAMTRAIRLWDGRTVIGLLTVHATGGSSFQIAGGAENAGSVDIEIDPFKGLMVDHGASHESSHVHEFPSCSLCISLGMEQANNVVTE